MRAEEKDLAIAVVPVMANELLRGSQEHHSVELTKLEPEVG